jgi:hypothetical protein
MRYLLGLAVVVSVCSAAEAQNNNRVAPMPQVRNGQIVNPQMQQQQRNVPTSINIGNGYSATGAMNNGNPNVVIRKNCGPNIQNGRVVCN